jgi:four helix bundle protein
MFLELSHTKLDVYKISREFTLLCYKYTKDFPADERFAMVQQIRRAAISVHLNIAEGASRKSLAERKRFFEISRGSIVEVDAAFDIAVELNYVHKESLQELGTIVLRCFQMLSKMINQ